MSKEWNQDVMAFVVRLKDHGISAFERASHPNFPEFPVDEKQAEVSPEQLNLSAQEIHHDSLS